MLRSRLDVLDPADVTASIAGLQLLPSNIHHLYRLERLVAYAARNTDTGSSRLSSSAIRGLLDCPEIGGPSVRSQEDPFEGFVSAEVPFFANTYLVLQGQATNSAVVARDLLGAVFASTHSFPVPYQRRVVWAARLLLRTSAELCQRAGLRRNSAAPTHTADIAVPSRQRLAELADRVTYEEDQLLRGFSQEATEYLRTTLIADLGDHKPWNGDGLDSAIITKPLLRTHRGVVVASPFELMATLRHLVVSEAVSNSCVDVLGDAMADLATLRTLRLFSTLYDHEPQLADESSSRVVRFTGVFDADKCLDLRVHVDTFDNYDLNSVFQTWERAEEPEYAETGHPDNRTLVVNVLWSQGRDVGVTLGTNDGPTLSGTYSDFETILSSPRTDQLSLWYFAQAKHRLLAKSQVMHFSLVDLYDTYIEHHESFYFSDDEPAVAVFVEPGRGDALRQANAERLGLTYVTIGKHTHEAILVHGNSSPVRRVFVDECLHFAELGDYVAWVQVAPDNQVTEAPLDRLAETVCFWISEIYTAAPRIFNELDSWEVRVTLKIADWKTDSPVADGSEWIQQESVDDGTIAISVSTPPDRAVGDPVNWLDRRILEVLIGALVTLTHLESVVDVDALIEQIAPPGERRMLHIVGAHDDPISWPGELPDTRRVVPSVLALLLDELGAHLSTVGGHTAGAFDEDERNRVLNTEVVPFFGEMLRHDLKTYDDHAALHYLIRANEALLRDAHVEERRYRARLACFGSSSDEVEKIEEKIRESAAAALGSRFLIEYLSAHPAPGNQLITTERYDRMLAASSEVVNKGFLSDALNAQISNSQLSLLASGRLGIAREDDQYMSALQGFLNSLASEALTEAAEYGTAEKSASTDDVDDNDFAQADQLAQVEYGFTYTQLAEFVSELVNLSVELAQHDVGELCESAVLQRMREKFSWEEDRIASLISELALSRQKNFWGQGNDVRPWRYGRARSYLRRPLVLRVSGDDRLIYFGHRNILLAAMYWHGQFDSGRLQAKTPEMNAALSRARELKGDRFEVSVASVLADSCRGVRRRVQKIAGHDLRKVSGKDLGDIDIVAFHEASRTLLLVEAKALVVARTPAELRNEIANVLDGEHSAMERLRGRFEWVQTHLPSVRNEFDLPGGSLNVLPIVVIDEDLMARQFENSPFQIVAIDQLHTFVTTLKGSGGSQSRKRRKRGSNANRKS